MRKVLVIASVLVVCVTFMGVGHARAAAPWYDGCITKYYGWGEGYNAEHGNDVSCFGFGTPITALLSGTVTYAGWTSFGYYEVTWQLDNPSAARGSPYAYAEDMESETVWPGEHINAGDVIGYSELWIEFGLTPDWAYGISNWRWGVDSLFLIQEAQNGTIGTTTVSSNQTSTTPQSSGSVTVKPGDSLWYLFGPAKWYSICRLNALANCNLIFPGQVLRT